MKHFNAIFKWGFAVLCFLFVSQSHAQLGITQIYTDFSGFWTTSTAVNNPLRPDTSHNLLAFTYNGITYSTGVNNAKLVLNTVSFTSLNLASFNIPNNSITGSSGSTYIGVGFDYGGSGNVLPLPVVNDIPLYLTDGVNGLDLGTGVFNIPASRITYPVSGFNLGTIGDGIPDVILTQIGDPPGSTQDTLYFADAAGNVLGNVQVGNVGAIPILGETEWKFYTPTNPPVYTNVGGPTRDLRIVGFDLQDFGLSVINLAQITSFIHKVSGSSDQAFLAHNTASFTSGNGVVLPVTLKSFTATKINETARLNWITVDVKSISYFEIEKSIGNTKSFFPAGKVLATNEITETIYSFDDKMPSSGTNYYRLKMVDDKGAFRYSTIVSLNFSSNVKSGMYPNPVAKMLTVNLPENAKEITIFSIDGKQIPVSLSDVKLNGGIDVSIIPVGVYTIRIITDSDITVDKFQVIR